MNKKTKKILIRMTGRIRAGRGNADNECEGRKKGDKRRMRKKRKARTITVTKEEKKAARSIGNKCGFSLPLRAQGSLASQILVA